MIDHEEIYKLEAERYDLLVAREDYQGRILPALRKIGRLEGCDVAELGAGTGRLTVLIAPLVNSIQAFDNSNHMLEFAARRVDTLGITNATFRVANHRELPIEDGCVDIALSGWSIGYFVSPANSGWRRDVEQTLVEMKRILRPGGTIIILETLGTGWEDPRAPTRELQAYYTYLESGQGFARTWIRTDYRFASLEEAEQTIEFFFGEELSRRVREEKLTVVPECTGIWWRKL
jgi:ubiquinone/menaquinone biosynthesis C-methylase UbiE